MQWISSRWKIILMLTPALAFFIAFIAYPVVYALGVSLTDFAGFGTAHFVGLDNYKKLGDDPFFWIALRNTFIILVIAVSSSSPCRSAWPSYCQSPFPGPGYCAHSPSARPSSPPSWRA